MSSNQYAMKLQEALNQLAATQQENERLTRENIWLRSHLATHSLHMDGSYGLRWQNAWPLSERHKGTLDEALEECMRLVEEESGPILEWNQEAPS